jgi:hypothetical protein
MPLSSARATTITFEDLSVGTVVTNQYANVVFSSNGAYQNRTVEISVPSIGFESSIYIGTFSSSSLDSSYFGETILTFLTPVSNLSFEAFGHNDATGTIAKVDVFVGGAFNSTADVLGVGFDPFGGFEDYANIVVDLTAFSNVTSIRIHGITDPQGLGWDNFSFNLGAGVSELPLPPSIALQLAGFGLLALAWRRTRKLTASA